MYTTKVWQAAMDFESPRDFDTNLGYLALSNGLANESGLEFSAFNSWAEFEKELRKMACVVLPVYGYKHGQIDLSTQVEGYWWHYRWDGNKYGYMFTTRQDILATYGWKRMTPQRMEQVVRDLKAELKRYVSWLNGDMYAYIVEDENGELLDSCSGFYSEEDAQQAADEFVANN